MQPQTRQQMIQKIHIGKSELGMDKNAYVAFLLNTVDKHSCLVMSDAELMIVLRAMQAKGFVVKSKKHGKRPTASLYNPSRQQLMNKIEAFLAEGKKGAKITLDFGEILQEGNFYRDNYREARSRFVYTADGKKEWIRPHFTFFGFRYVRVAGWEKTPDPADFCGCVLYSDMERTGFIKTNHEKLNRLYENTLWGLKSNFLDILTDCPQRNERLGWTGDAQVFAPTASYHVNTSAFFRKFLRDLRDEQSFLSGGIPNYFPNIGHKEDVTNVWGDIAVFLPLVLYRHYGSKRDLSASYPLMRDWVEFLDKKDSERGLQSYIPNLSFQFGD